MTFERPNNDFDDYQPQALASVNDVDEFRAGIASFIKGDWHADRWKTFRLRFGIYEQRQAGEHMMRVKLPGGRISLAQARTIARANADFGGGDIHITTRQGVQLYFIAFKNLAPLVEALNQDGESRGVSTREASGSTFRAITACPKAGFCGAELTDAASVAGHLTRAWLRHPLTQHMPRKFKTSVSGCGQDCGLSAIDDLGFIATEQDGQKGFRVVVGGGLGTHPTVATELFEFVEAEALPTVQEAVARVHIGHSSRENKNRSRIKFLLARLGRDEFVRLVHAQFNTIRDFERRAWAELDWNDTIGEAGTLRLSGQLSQPTGNTAVGIDVPLGWLTSAQLEKLADLAEAAGAAELRFTRAQNIIAVGLKPAFVQSFIDGARNIGLDASGRKHALENLVSCPGVYTCAIGITDSHALAESLLDAGPEFAGFEPLRVRLSGCHNACGHHHIADIGLHGIAKKIGGKPAPHYQIHLGGETDNHGLLGPIVAARRAKQAVRLLMQAIHTTKGADESVRAWAERLGTAGIEDILAQVLQEVDAQAATLRLDVASDDLFVPPATSTGECAAGAVVAEHLSDLARVARQDIIRAEQAGNREQAIQHVHEALILPAQRLATLSGGAIDAPTAQLLDAIRRQWPHNAALLNALDQALQAEASVQSGGTPSDSVLVLRAWQSAADTEIERILGSIPGYFAGAAQ